MRCKKCDVDLPSSYKKCPLCHEPATDEPAFLDIPEAPFPKEYLAFKPPKKFDLPVKYIIRFGFVLSIILGIVSVFTVQFLWTSVIPLILTVLSLSCVISSFFEKSLLHHSLVALLSVVSVNLIFLLITCIINLPLKYMIISFLISVGFFVLLFVVKPKKSCDQLKALFNI